MPTVVILATSDLGLAERWKHQLPGDCISLCFGKDGFADGANLAPGCVVVLDALLEPYLPPALRRSPTIFVGEPRSTPFEQAKLEGRAKFYLSYQESATALKALIPVILELAEKQSLIEMLGERMRRSEGMRAVPRSVTSDSAELWDFVEGTVENLDTRDRLIAEFRRASRNLLRASHAVFFLKDADGFRADRGTSFFPINDPIVSFFESHPAVIDGTSWDGPSDPISELAVRSRLALWGARLLVPIHDNGRLLGLIALGVRDDGQPYEEADKSRTVFVARLLRHALNKCSSFHRLSQIANQVALGSKYLPGTLVLGPEDPVPRHVPLVVRDVIGQVRRSREVTRASPCAGQPFRVSSGIVTETGGIWAFWEEASAEVHDAQARERTGRRELLRDLGLTLSHELGNALVSLTTFRQSRADRSLPEALIETIKRDVSQLEKLNNHLALMHGLHEAEPDETDIREVAQAIGSQLGVRVEVGPDPVVIIASRRLLEFTLQALVRTVAENRPDHGLSELAIKVRSTGSGTDITALLSIKGKSLELEGILPEPVVDAVPSQGRMSVFLAKEILRLHHGEIHAGPGMEGTEILISFRGW
jgi:hypothetical protein